MKPLSDEAIQEAFDGDFGEITFDHKPTEEEVFLIKLNLVARAAEEERGKQWVEWGNEVCTDITHSGTMKRRECGFCWQEMVK